MPNPETYPQKNEAHGSEESALTSTLSIARDSVRTAGFNPRLKREATKGDKRPMTVVNLRLGGQGEDCAQVMSHQSPFVLFILFFLFSIS